MSIIARNSWSLFVFSKRCAKFSSFNSILFNFEFGCLITFAWYQWDAKILAKLKKKFNEGILKILLLVRYLWCFAQLVPFVRFKKHKKHPWRSSKSITPPWVFLKLYKVDIPQSVSFNYALQSSCRL